MKEVCMAVARFRNDKKEAISKNFVNLAEGFASGGYLVSTYTPTRFETSLPIRQHYLRTESRYSSLVEAVHNLFRICRAIKKRRVENSVVNFHIATPMELMLLFLFLDEPTRRRTAVSIWQSYLTFREFKNKFSYFSRNLLKYLHIILLNSFVTAFSYKLLLGKFGSVIVHSTYLRDQLVKFSNRKITFVQNGVLPEDAPLPMIPPRNVKFILLYIGHAKPSKGVCHLMELAATLLRRGNIDFTLVLSLSGFGDERAVKRSIRDLGIEDHIVFKQEIDVIGEMAVSDLFILPLPTCIGTSLSPNVVIEALSVGLPIAVPDHPELSGLIQFGSNALKLDLADLDGSAEEIEAAAHQGPLRWPNSANQRKRFRHQFSLERFIEGYIRELLTT